MRGVFCIHCSIGKSVAVCLVCAFLGLASFLVLKLDNQYHLLLPAGMSILQFWFFWQQRGPSLLLVMPAALSRNNDILECNFLDRKVNKIIVLVAATLVLISIVLVGLLNNLGFDNSKGITRFTFQRKLWILLFEWSLYYCHTCQGNLGFGYVLINLIQFKEV